MPKASPKSITTRKHGQSAKKSHIVEAGAGTSQAASSSIISTSATNTSAADDASQWRASKLRDSDTITKTDVRKLYRLSKEDDYEGIPFTTELIDVGGTMRPMFIYKERDIERRAWEKHGGPEGFDKYLAKLKESYLKKYGPHAHFQQPSTYDDPNPSISIARLPGTSRTSGPIDIYATMYPRLLGYKNQMVPWFWTAYNDALSLVDNMDDFWDEGGGRIGGHGVFTSATARAGPMKDALVMMPTYPPRPTERLSSSASVDKVRAALAGAASLPSAKDWGRKDLPGLTAIFGTDEEDEPTCEYRWSDDYLERLFSALIEVVEAHGTGPEGFEGIRWEVYDKFVKFMMVGPRYHRGKKMWMDDPAAEWLDGQLSSLETTYRGMCSAGKRFNEMLPRLNAEGSRSVGVRPLTTGRRSRS